MAPLRRLVEKVSKAWGRHQDRHRATGFEFAISDRISHLNPQYWDSIAQENSLFLQRPFLSVLEETLPANLSPRYAIISRNNSPLAILAAQFVNISADKVLKHDKDDKNGKDEGIEEFMEETDFEDDDNEALEKRSKRQQLLEKVRARVLVCGNLLSWGWHGVAYAPNIEIKEIWPGVAEALYRIRRAERLSGQTNLIMLKDFPPDQEHGVEALTRYSYRALETEPNMVLAIAPTWQTYDDYLASLTASYRKAARKIFKTIDEAGCQVERVTDLKPHAKRLHKLYLAVHDNAHVRPVTIPAQFFTNLAQALGDNFRCHIIRREGEILGFVTSLRDKRETIGYYIGFDRAASAELPIYLRLLHTLIGDAIEWRTPRLSMGRTALEPKARLGCQPEPFKIWVRHRQPAINLLVRNLLRAIPHEQAPDRNPFK